jgi:hypothetical protein
VLGAVTLSDSTSEFRREEVEDLRKRREGQCSTKGRMCVNLFARANVQHPWPEVAEKLKKTRAQRHVE